MSTVPFSKLKASGLAPFGHKTLRLTVSVSFFLRKMKLKPAAHCAAGSLLTFSLTELLLLLG